MNFQQAGWIQEKHVLVANNAANFASEDKMFKFGFLEKANKGNCESSDNCQQIIGIVDVPSIGKTLVTLLVLSTAIPAQASAEDSLFYEQQSVFQDFSSSESQIQVKSEPVLENALKSDVTPERKNDRLHLDKSNIFGIDHSLRSAIASPEMIVEENTSANSPIENIDDPSLTLPLQRGGNWISNSPALQRGGNWISNSPALQRGGNWISNFPPTLRERKSLVQGEIKGGDFRDMKEIQTSAYTVVVKGEDTGFLISQGDRGVKSVFKAGKEISDVQQLNEILYQQVFESSKFEFSQLKQSQLESDKRNSQIVDNAPEPVLENPNAEEILEQLEKLPNTDIPLPPQDRGYLSSPGITISNPNGYGADGNTLFAVADFQKRTRFTRTSDGELAFGIGLGNAVKFVGAELTYTLNTLGTSQGLGSGAFSIKLHRRIAEDLAVAVGWNQFADVYINARIPFDYPKNSYYAVVTKVFKMREFINEPFSRVAVTAGIGSGQFLPFDTINQAVIRGENPTGLNVFGSVGVRVFEPVSAIVEWTGQDLGVGLSIVPFKNLPFVITPAFRDITGAGDGARFIMGAGVSLRL